MMSIQNRSCMAHVHNSMNKMKKVLDYINTGISSADVVAQDLLDNNKHSGMVKNLMSSHHLTYYKHNVLICKTSFFVLQIRWIRSFWK